MEKPKFVYVTHIASTPEKVFAALTQPEFTALYYGGRKIQSDWTVGASIKFIKPGGGIDLVGEVIEIKPPHLLACTFLGMPPDGSPATEKPSRVTFEISGEPGLTTLTILHTDFEPGSKLIHEVGFGWQAIACSMKSFLETGKALPFQWPA